MNSICELVDILISILFCFESFEFYIEMETECDPKYDLNSHLIYIIRLACYGPAGITSMMPQFNIWTIITSNFTTIDSSASSEFRCEIRTPFLFYLFFCLIHFNMPSPAEKPSHIIGLQPSVVMSVIAISPTTFYLHLIYIVLSISSISVHLFCFILSTALRCRVLWKYTFCHYTPFVLAFTVKVCVNFVLLLCPRGVRRQGMPPLSLLCVGVP